MGVEAVKIAVDVGVSLQVRGVDWVKPCVSAELTFDELPDIDEVHEKWDWLWDQVVNPQVEKLLIVMQQEMTRRLGEWQTAPDPPGSNPAAAAPSSAPPVAVRTPSDVPPPAPDETY